MEYSGETSTRAGLIRVVPSDCSITMNQVALNPDYQKHSFPLALVNKQPTNIHLRCSGLAQEKVAGVPAIPKSTDPVIWVVPGCLLAFKV